jgi:hypothetical protein
MGVRLPTILGKAIDDVWRTVNETVDEDRIVDLIACIERMDGLMTDLSQNNKLRFIVGAWSVRCWALADVLQTTARATFPCGTRRSPSTSRARTL